MEDKLSVGANVYYDYRNSPHLRTSQIAGGIEFLSRQVDFRLNGYLPVGGKEHVGSLKFAGFSDHQIDVRRKTYYAFPSANAEFGIPLPWLSTHYIDTYFGIGPYYLFGSTLKGNRYQSSWGGKFRLSSAITDYLSLEVELNYDHIFKTTFQGVVAVNIPLYKKKACRRDCLNAGSYFRRTLQPVIRNEIIPVKKKSKVSALRDSSGNVIQAFFVNNAVACPGLGTFESPFCTLVQANSAPGGSLIYVFEGDSPTTPYSGAFVMKDGQTLQGSGISLDLNGITIPPYSAGNPVLTNPAGSVVTLASSTTVNGLTIRTSAAGQSAIVGTNVADVTVTNNLIEQAGFQGIQLVSHSGNVFIAHNTVINPGSNGISIDSSPNPGTVEIVYNTLVNAPGSGVLIRLDNPDANGFVMYNNFSSTFAGFDIGTEVVEGSLTLAFNHMNSNSFFSIHALDGRQFIHDNVVNTVGAAAGISYDITAAGMSPAQSYIYNNQVNLSGAGLGISVMNFSAPGDLYSEVFGNTVASANPANGIFIRTQNAGNKCTSVSENHTNTITLAGAAGPLNVRQSQAEFTSQNTASVGFATSGTVNFSSTCTPP